MSTREDMKRFYGMDLDFGAIGLQKPDRDMVYFCTPEGAEPAGSLGVDGIHFVLLPGDERVFCVDPSMMILAWSVPEPMTSTTMFWGWNGKNKAGPPTVCGRSFLWRYSPSIIFTNI